MGRKKKGKKKDAYATLRERCGLTQQDMAQLLGVSRSHYSMAESKNRGMRMSTHPRISDWLDRSEINTIPPRDKESPREKALVEERTDFVARRKAIMDSLILVLENRIKKMEHQFEDRMELLHRYTFSLPKEKRRIEDNDMLLELVRNRLREKIQECTPLKQEMLRLKLAALYGEKAYLDAL